VPLASPALKVTVDCLDLLVLQVLQAAQGHLETKVQLEVQVALEIQVQLGWQVLRVYQV